MPYSEFLADRVRRRLSPGGHLVEKKMMGGLVFMDTDRSTGDDRLMVRVGKAAHPDYFFFFFAFRSSVCTSTLSFSLPVERLFLSKSSY